MPKTDEELVEEIRQAILKRLSESLDRIKDAVEKKDDFLLAGELVVLADKRPILMATAKTLVHTLTPEAVLERAEKILRE